MQFKKCINNHRNSESRKVRWKLELDESYFGGKRKLKRERWAKIKQLLLEFSREKGKVHRGIAQMYQQTFNERN